jgi:O-antigen/teichoic acid export membrane protein
MINLLKKSSLLRSSGIYTLTNMLNSAIPFLMMPVLTRFMSPEDYGIVAMFTVIIGFLVPIVGINMNGAISRQYYERETIDFRVYLGNAFILLALNFIIIACIVWLLAEPISLITSFPKEWLWAVLLVASFQVITQITLVIWQVQVKPISYGVFQILQTLLNVGLTLYLVVLARQGWEGRIEGQTIAFIVFGIIGFFLLLKNGWIKFDYNASYMKHILKFGIPLIPHTIGAFVITMMDRVFITNMVGVAETGIYTVGYQIGMIIGILQDSFNKAWVPWFFERLKRDNEEEKRKIVKITYLYFIVILLIALILSLLAPALLSFFVGEEFKESSSFVIWIAFGFAFNGMYKMVTNYIFYLQQTRYLMYLTFLTAILNTLLNYIFIKYYGAVGAAIATTISFFIIFIFTWILSSKIYKMPWAIWKGMISDEKGR